MWGMREYTNVISTQVQAVPEGSNCISAWVFPYSDGRLQKAAVKLEK